jgi:hypothetical protein
LDDWAYKRRLRYGTLICDLERSQPIDLLPDRSVETVEAWLKKHPSIAVVSRDGSAEYASVQIERETCRFRNKYLPLLGSYCEKSNPLDDLIGRNTCHNS